MMAILGHAVLSLFALLGELAKGAAGFLFGMGLVVVAFGALWLAFYLFFSVLKLLHG